MRITILNDGHRNCGGCLQLIKYANLMVSAGHEVNLVYDGSFSFDLIPVAAHRIYAPTLASDAVPDADAVISSSWYMAEKLVRLPRAKGEKFYYVQDFESWSGTSEEIIASWRLPAHKIAVAEYLKDMIARHTGVHVPVMPYGIDFGHFYAPNKTPPGKEIVVGALYNPMTRKRFHDVAACVGLLRKRDMKVRFLCFGAESAPDLDFPFTYLQKPGQKELRHLYEACHVWLALSEQEGLHIPPMEAMACGVVPVTTAIGGMRDYCLPGKTGLSVPVGDVEAAANSVTELMSDQDRWKHLSDGALAHIRGMGSECENAQTMVAYFSDTIRRTLMGHSPLFDFTLPNKNVWATCEVYTRVARRKAEDPSELEWAADLASGVVDFVDSQAASDPRFLARQAPMYGEALVAQAASRKARSASPLSLERAARFNPDEIRGLEATAGSLGFRLGRAYINRARFDGHLRIYPTLLCNYSCAYCVNEHVHGVRKTSSSLPPEAWAAIINREGRHVVLTGGEPFLYPGLVELINAIHPQLIVRVYTNFGLDVRRHIPRLERECHFYVSWHPNPRADRELFVDNLETVRKNSLLWAEVHAIRTSETSHRLNSDLEFFTHQKIKLRIDPDQRDFEGTGKESGSKAFCRRRIYLLGPDGTRYPCVSRLMRQSGPMENAAQGPLGPDICFSLCPDYGVCAPCDGLGETSIHLLERP